MYGLIEGQRQVTYPRVVVHHQQHSVHLLHLKAPT
jgi:hypothetical protein